jgi:hypothetical protein
MTQPPALLLEPLQCAPHLVLRASPDGAAPGEGQRVGTEAEHHRDTKEQPAWQSTPDAHEGQSEQGARDGGQRQPTGAPQPAALLTTGVVQRSSSIASMR